MPTLHEVQHAVMNSLLGSADESALALLAARDGRAAARLRVYQNNAAANFLASLESTYPAIAKLVGDDYFRQVSRALQQRHPSRSGDLLWVGRHLPDYLAELHAEGDHRYLADVARLEWLCQESLLAAGHEPLDFGKLARAASSPDALVFILHPTARYFESRFPVLQIWRSNIAAGEGDPPIIDLAAGTDRVLLVRPGKTLQFHCLSTIECDFFHGLRAEHCFAAIVERCAEAEPSFDATSTLQRFVGMGAIVDCRW